MVPDLGIPVRGPIGRHALQQFKLFPGPGGSIPSLATEIARNAGKNKRTKHRHRTGEMLYNPGSFDISGRATSALGSLKGPRNKYGF